MTAMKLEAGSSSRYKGNLFPEFQKFCSETCFHPRLLVKQGSLIATKYLLFRGEDTRLQL
jgi:hypothetical protein